MGGDLAVEFANTVFSPTDPGGTLHSWSDLIDFLELRGGLAPGDGAMLRAMGATDARRCAGAFAQALALRETIRAMLGAVASRRPLRAGWIAEVNEALAAGLGAPRLIRQDGGWRLGLSPGLGRAPPGPGPDRARCGRPGRVGPWGRDRQVRQPAVRALLPRPVPDPPAPLVRDGRLRQSDEGGRPRAPPWTPPLRLACFALDRSPGWRQAMVRPADQQLTRTRFEEVGHGSLHVRGRLPRHLPEEPGRAHLPRHRALRTESRALGDRLRALRRQPAA